MVISFAELSFSLPIISISNCVPKYNKQIVLSFLHHPIFSFELTVHGIIIYSPGNK
jgi:hypothetical protein